MAFNHSTAQQLSDVLVVTAHFQAFVELRSKRRDQPILGLDGHTFPIVVRLQNQWLPGCIGFYRDRGVFEEPPLFPGWLVPRVSMTNVDTGGDPPGPASPTF